MGIKSFLKKKLLSPEDQTKSPGKRGEEIACVYLKKEGYRVRDKNFRSRYGEVDIIAHDSDTLCFIEVKSRSRTDHGRPEEFVDSRKQQKLVKTAYSYIAKHRIEDTPMRFDIIAVDLVSATSKILKNAFQISGDI